PHRAELIKDVQRLAPVLAKYQDAKTGTWSLVMGQEGRKGNYAEASGSSMFVYALAKGARMGYLDKKYAAVAKKGYDGLVKSFVATENGALALNGTVSVGGLGGSPYRDGSYEYYLSEPLRKDDLKGVGPFILASVELEIAAENAVGQGKTVGLDYYFNHELRKSAFTGQPEQWHYTWEDRTHGGFWLWGNQLRELGAKTVSVTGAPTEAALKGLSAYVIVDPDTKKENPNPSYIQPTDSKAITDWVRAGGSLVLLANDTANCEIKHFNELARNFGVQFTDKSINMVQGSQFEQGRVDLTGGKTVFSQAKTAYVKELAVLGLQGPAKALVSNAAGQIIMATATLGKGKVFVLGDPWLYNEYTDGRKIPAVYENFQAGKDLGGWLLGK
ncbi:MAG: glycoside hydrolase family 88 protein, partial [Hymenobacter sp.]